MNSPEHKCFGCMSFEERSALEDLISNYFLLISEADKGCSDVVIELQSYIEEGYRQLSNTSAFLWTHAAATNVIVEDVQHLAVQLHIQGVITDDIGQFTIRRITKPARFCLISNVHENGVPGRTVVSACRSATEGMSEIVNIGLHNYSNNTFTYQ